MLVESDDRTGGAGIRILIENHRRFVGFDLAPKKHLGDQVVHSQVGLMEP